MRRTAAVRFLAAVVTASLVVTACGTAATPAPASVAPTAAPASAAPTAAPSSAAPTAAPSSAAPASSAPASSAAASPSASETAAASASASAAASPAASQSEGTIRIIGPEPTQGLDPTIAAADASRGPIDLMFDTLVASQDETGKLQGDLAETWDVSADAKTYTFHLRAGHQVQ